MLPFWKITEKFIGGAMPATPDYRTLISEQQTFLDNNGYQIDYESNWYTPWDDISNTEYTQYYWGANASYNYLLNDHLEARLYNNYNELRGMKSTRLRPSLNNSLLTRQ